MESNTLEEVKNWLNLAKNDLETSTLLINAKIYSNSAYHSQQSSEKAVKAILILMNEQIYEHKVSSEFYDIVYFKYPYEYIEKIYFLLSELETHWLKSRYILKTRNNDLLDPLKLYDSKKAKDLNQKAKKILDYVNKFLKEEFDLIL